MVEIGLIFERGAKTTSFQREYASCLAFCVVVKIDLISVWGFELDLIPVYDEMDLVFVRVVENDVISVCWIGIDLVFV